MRLRPVLRRATGVTAILGVLLVVPVFGAAPAYAADPVQVQMTLEGCRLPDLASSCLPVDFTTGNLGKNWAELDLVPYRLTLENNGATQTFDIRLSADHLLGTVQGYDYFTLPTASAGCAMTVVTRNEVSPLGVVGGVDRVLTTRLQIQMAAGASCTISWAQRLALGAHNYSGGSLQSQILNADYSSGGQRTVSIFTREVEPQQISKTATAFTTPSYTWTVGTTSPSAIDLDSCLPAPTAPNLTYTVSYTRTKVAGPIDTVSGTITLTNPANRSLVAAITDTVRRGTTTVGGGTLPDVTVPANGSIAVPYSFAISAAGTGALTNTASAVFHDPDIPGVDLPPLSVTVAAPVSVTELPATGDTAVVTDTESASSGLTYTRTAPQPAGPTTGDSFATTVSDGGSFTVSKIVAATTAGNYAGTLTNAVSLDPAGAAAAVTTDLVVPVHVTAAAPVLTIDKHVDVAPAAATDFGFTVTNEETDATTPVTVTIAAGATSGSASVTVAPSSAGYTIAEDAPPAGYDATAPVATGALGWCGSRTVRVDNARSRADLSLTKAVDGDTAPAGGFVFQVSCDDGTTATLTFHAGGTQTVSGLPTGTVCQVTEDAAPGWTSTPAGTQAVTIDADGAEVAFTNTRNVGSLSVTKAIVGDAAPAGGFVFSVSCTDGTAATLLFTAAGTQTVDGILSGSTCTVTETPAEGWTSTPAGPQQVTLDLADGSVATVSFTNTRQDAGLRLVKTVDLEEAEYGDTLTYGLTVTNTGERPLHAVEVSDAVPDKTTYVAGSATCAAPCTASYDAATDTVHWAVGDLAAGASFAGLVFKVTIDTPAAAADGSVPATVVVNSGTTTSPPDVVDPVRSNEVRTVVVAVLGRKLVKELPRTGSGLPIPQAVILALALLAGGGLLLHGSRRSRPGTVHTEG